MGVGGGFLRLRLGEPREGDAVFLKLEAQVVDAQRLFDETALGVQQLGQVPDLNLIERNRNREAHVFLLSRFLRLLGHFHRCLASEARSRDAFQHPLDLLAVGAVVKKQGAILGDGEVVDFIIAGRHELVDRLGSSDTGDDFDQLLAPVAGYVVPDFHGEILLCMFSPFRVVTYSLYRHRIASQFWSINLTKMCLRTCVIVTIRRLARRLSPALYRVAFRRCG